MKVLICDKTENEYIEKMRAAGLTVDVRDDITPEELDGYFPEMRELVEACQFNDCTHVHEPGCAVRAAVETGNIHPWRYKSYLHMRFGEEE